MTQTPNQVIFHRYYLGHRQYNKTELIQIWPQRCNNCITTWSGSQLKYRGMGNLTRCCMHTSHNDPFWQVQLVTLSVQVTYFDKQHCRLSPCSQLQQEAVIHLSRQQWDHRVDVNAHILSLWIHWMGRSECAHILCISSLSFFTKACHLVNGKSLRAFSASPLAIHLSLEQHAQGDLNKVLTSHLHWTLDRVGIQWVHLFWSLCQHCWLNSNALLVSIFFLICNALEAHHHLPAIRTTSKKSAEQSSREELAKIIPSMPSWKM